MRSHRRAWLLWVSVALIAMASAEYLVAGGAAQKPGQPLKLTYYFYGSAAEKQAEEAALAAFMRANPTIAIEPIHVPSAYEDKVRTVVAGGTPPDAAVWNPAHLPSLYKALHPLDQYIATDLDKSVYTAPDHFLNSGKYEGHFYHLPRTFSGIAVMVYNKTLFKQNGLSLPSEPYPRKITVEEFANYARAIAKDLTGDGVNDIYGCDTLMYEILFPWFGVPNEGLGSDYHTPQWLTPKGLDTLKFIQTAQNVEKWALPLGEKRVEWFMLGRLGMMTDFGTWFLPELNKITDFEWDIAARPGKEAPLAAPGGVVIFGASQNKDAAWSLAKFLSTSIEAQTAYMPAFGMGVTNKSVELYLSKNAGKNFGYMARPVLSEIPVATGTQPTNFGDIMVSIWQSKEAFYAGEMAYDEWATRMQRLITDKLREEEQMKK